MTFAEGWQRFRQGIGGFPDRLERGVARHEKTIAAASGIATAVGLLFAGVSAFATWQQLQILNRERSTPFRAILWEKKVESLREFDLSSSSLLEAANKAATAVISLNSGTRENDTAERFSVVLKSFEELERSESRAIAIWPTAVSRKMSFFRITIKEVTRCFDGTYSFPKTVGPCSIPELRHAFSRAETNLYVSKAAMIDDVKIDRYQQLSN